ncbi:MAG: M14 family metallopeptidase [Polaribacter sp.]
MDIYKGDKKNKPLIILLTRQHPPEVTGFFAYQEFLKTILEENKLTSEFLNTYRVLAFPIANPDGVDLGHWRHNAGGVDTNRDWSKYNQPEIKQVVKFITKASKKDKGKIILGVDFHSTYHDVFYTNKTRKGTTLPTFIEQWFAALETNIPNYKVNEAIANSTKPVSKGWFLYGHNAVGITYEIGDKTPRDNIKLVGKITAQEMMKILIKTTLK